eukprot:6185911-Pleurochrysis_carterae.AAC.1
MYAPSRVANAHMPNARAAACQWTQGAPDDAVRESVVLHVNWHGSFSLNFARRWGKQTLFSLFTAAHLTKLPKIDLSEYSNSRCAQS